MLDWIAEYWVRWAFGLVGAFFASFITWLLAKLRRDKKNEALHKEIEQLKNNHQELKDSHAEVKDLLEKLVSANNVNQYDKLYYLHKKFMRQGWISIDDLQNVRNIYYSYHALGGNGHGTALYKDLDELPSH